MSKWVIIESKTVGTILSVKKQWWLKVNTKPIRKHALDGATFPHIVTLSCCSYPYHDSH